MTDPIVEVAPVEDPIEEVVTESAPVKPQERTFTQKELDDVVKNRVAREQASQRDLRKQLEDAEKKHQEDVDRYEKILAGIVDAQLEGLPESTVSLLRKLPVLDRLEWLSDPKNLSEVSKRGIPSTPHGEAIGSKEPSDPKSSMGKLF